MKKTTSLLLFTFVLGLIFSSCTVNKPEPPKRTITVSGNGSVSVNPDIISIRFVVRTSDWNVNVASEKNAEYSTNALNAIKEQGVAESDICTYNYKISQDNSNSYPGKYTVSNEISVTIRNIDNAGKIIDAAVKNNAANGVTKFEYVVSDNESAIRQARTLAVQDAQNAAALLAGASGCKIDSVLNIEEYAPITRNNAIVPALKTTNASTTPITEGSVSITSEVRITYSLIN